MRTCVDSVLDEGVEDRVRPAPGGLSEGSSTIAQDFAHLFEPVRLRWSTNTSAPVSMTSLATANPYPIEINHFGRIRHVNDSGAPSL